jgi:rhodanese-related sulfurtransferase
MTPAHSTFARLCLALVLVFPLSSLEGLAEKSVPRANRQGACPERIGLAEFTRLLDSHDVVVIDVRDPAAYWQAHLPGALSIPADLIESSAPAFATSDASVVIYGDDPSGEASLRAASALRRRGVAQAQALTGGFQRWVASGRVVITQPDEQL